MTLEYDDLAWVEKYRPKTIDECILPERIKKDFKSFIETKSFPNLLLTGSAGTGKTTIARALCSELGYDVIVINASNERNIAMVRETITSFASTTSLMGNQKAIILDEADGLNRQSSQPALRAAIEEFKHVKFILTCNYKNMLIEPLQSRTTTISFNINNAERTNVAAAFLKRVFEILEKENIKFDKKAVAAIVKQFFPDNRRILNELQRYAQCGEIDEGILSVLQPVEVSSLVKAFKTRDIGAIRQWVANNKDSEAEILFRSLYDGLYAEVSPDSVCQLILIIAEYQYYATMVADHEINFVACLIKILGEVEFR